MQPMLSLFAFVFLGAVTSSQAARRQLTKSPVEKVVLLLKDLKGKLEQDDENEQKIYDKYACFCDKALKAKADAIEKAQKELRLKGQEILKFRGTIATLTAEIKEKEEEIEQNQKEQADATAIRQKENAIYMAETAEVKEALLALQQAILVLRNATQPTDDAAPALLQGGSAAAARSQSALKQVLQVLPSKARLTKKQLSLLGSLAEGRSEYAPQSVTVQGILRDMYETFAMDLEKSTENEAKANRDYELLIATLVAELEELQEIKAKLEAEKAEAEEQLAEATAIFDKTEAQMKADIEYFDITKKGCQDKHAEWELRSQLRSEELLGISKALEVLTSDAARELFGKAIKAGKETHVDDKYDAGVSPSFLQVGDAGAATSPAAAKSAAYEALKAQASGAHSFRLAQLAVRVRTAKFGHFDAVIKQIDNVIANLKEEDAADIAKRDHCKEEYKKIESTASDLQWKIKNNEATIEKLEKIIAKREAEKEQTIEEIATVEDQMRAMTEERTAENQEFKQKKKEDQDAIALIDEAKVFLFNYYKKNNIELGPIQGAVKGLALQQQQQPAFEVSKFQAPEATFSDKGSRKFESKDILSIMTYLIEDLTDEIKNGMKDEEEAQLQYENAMAAAEKLKDELEAKKLALEEAIALREEEKSEERRKLSTNDGKLMSELSYKKSITPDCDWIIGAWAGRAKRRTAEMAGLVGAKEYLVGATSAALLQGGATTVAPAFDDAALAKVDFLGLGA